MLSVLDLQSVLESENGTSASTAETDWSSQQHGMVSALETGWDRPQHVENTDWHGHSVSPSMALVNNISMTSPVSSTSSTDSIFSQQNGENTHR